MIRVGGNSYNNGIRFVGDRYNVSFETRNDSTNMYLRKNGVYKINKVMEVLRKIPLLRGVVSIICSNKLLLSVVLLDILMNFSNVFEQSGNDTQNIVPMLVFLIAMLVLTSLMLVYAIKKLFKNMKRTWQYHGAEHKVIYTNYAKKDITLENCRVSPRVNDNCGTMLVSLILITWVVLKVMLIIFGVSLYASIETCIVISVAYELFLMKRNTPVVSYAFKIGYWMQKHLFTSEPSDDQLLQAIEAFKLLEKAEANQLSESELNDLLRNGKKMSILNRIV